MPRGAVSGSSTPAPPGGCSPLPLPALPLLPPLSLPPGGPRGLHCRSECSCLEKSPLHRYFQQINNEIW